MITNGMKVSDVITGLSGTVTGVVTYIDGAHQALVSPPITSEGKPSDAQWIAVERLRQQPGSEILRIDRGTPLGETA